MVFFEYTFGNVVVRSQNTYYSRLGMFGRVLVNHIGFQALYTVALVPDSTYPLFPQCSVALGDILLAPRHPLYCPYYRYFRVSSGLSYPYLCCRHSFEAFAHQPASMSLLVGNQHYSVGFSVHMISANSRDRLYPFVLCCPTTVGWVLLTGVGRRCGYHW